MASACESKFGIFEDVEVSLSDGEKANGMLAEVRCTPSDCSTARTPASRASRKGQTYNLHGEPITQAQLAWYLNQAFGTELTYRPMSVQGYLEDRTEELGSFLGGVIAGIYEGIRMGALDVPSGYQRAAGRPHQSWHDYFDRIGSSKSADRS